MISERYRKAVILWLVACAALVFLMVVVGGLTRLTESGLSIVEWKPVAGILPPMSDDAWQTEFDAYKTSPQYLKINTGMALGDFKNIFWLEYLHRLLGRAIGLVFLVPFLWFLWKKAIPPTLTPRLWGIFMLGGAQGAFGWYMVMSGLVNEPAVSPIRLATHLIIAFLIYALLVWSILDLMPKDRLVPSASPPPALRTLSWVLVLLVLAQVKLGAFVAGNDAGLAYNTFPLMDGAFIPAGMGELAPWYRNLFENVATVQFMHRIGAYVLCIFISFFWLCARKYVTSPPGFYGLLNILPLVLILQVVLGVLTLVKAVPVNLASMHQAVAIVLFTVSVMLSYGFTHAVTRQKN